VALARTRHRTRRFTVPVDVSVVLRAVAVMLILVSHADIQQLQGGAHVLLAVAGYNLARFQLALSDRVARVRGILRSALNVAVPVSAWIAAVTVVTGDYRWQTAVFLNGVTGTGRWTDDWQFWFLEALVWCYLAIAALMMLPWVDRWSRRSPFAVAVGVAMTCLAVRYALVGVEAGPVERYQPVVVLWCLALGWAAAAADTPARRLVVAAAAVVSTIGFFGDLQREVIVIAGILLLLADRAVLLPRILATAVQALAAASLWIYLTQWQVYPGIEDAGHPHLAVLAAVAVGICAHLVYERVNPTALGRWRPHTSRRTASASSRAPAPGGRAAGD
jgi:peptidoglycan/LPS O-acetylase OafA/YrhL